MVRHISRQELKRLHRRFSRQPSLESPEACVKF